MQRAALTLQCALLGSALKEANLARNSLYYGEETILSGGIMEQSYIESLPARVGSEVRIKGWLYNKRSSGKIRFIQVRDGTGILQAVASVKDVDETSFEQMDALPIESSLEVVGEIRAVRLLGGGEAVWERRAGGLVVDLAGVEASDASVAVWRIDL